MVHCLQDGIQNSTLELADSKTINSYFNNLLNTDENVLFYFSYFINHYTKTTVWEDPRVKYQQIGKPTSKESNKLESSASSTIAPPYQSTSSGENPPVLQVCTNLLVYFDNTLLRYTIK